MWTPPPTTPRLLAGHKSQISQRSIAQNGVIKIFQPRHVFLQIAQLFGIPDNFVIFWDFEFFEPFQTNWEVVSLTVVLLCLGNWIRKRTAGLVFFSVTVEDEPFPLRLATGRRFGACIKIHLIKQPLFFGRSIFSQCYRPSYKFGMICFSICPKFLCGCRLLGLDSSPAERGFQTGNYAN